MRVWVDLTNSPHVLVLRPVIARCASSGAEVRGDGARLRADARAVRAPRDRAHGDRPPPRRAGGRQGARARLALRRAGALGARAGASTSRSATAPTTSRSPRRCCGSPRTTTFDYEWATVQHNVNCRLAQAVVVPGGDPARSACAATARRGKLQRYAGLKEEYYLADFEPDAGGARRARPRPRRSRSWWCARRRRSSLYHRFENDLFARGAASACAAAQAVVLPRTPRAARRSSRRAGGFIVPERAIDAQSLIAHADLVVSAGGTMNREAVALGTPVLHARSRAASARSTSG